MNKSKILAVANAIEFHSIPDLGFNMGTFISVGVKPEWDRSGHNCGTTACIGGWAVAMSLSLHKLKDANYDSDVFDLAKKILQLDDITASDLMVGFVGNPTSAQAAACLRHLADTGEVNWCKFVPDDPDED